MKDLHQKLLKSDHYSFGEERLAECSLVQYKLVHDAIVNAKKSVKGINIAMYIGAVSVMIITIAYELVVEHNGGWISVTSMGVCVITFVRSSKYFFIGLYKMATFPKMPDRCLCRECGRSCPYKFEIEEIAATLTKLRYEK